jgi:hypothetical protein
LQPGIGTHYSKTRCCERRSAALPENMLLQLRVGAASSVRAALVSNGLMQRIEVGRSRQIMHLVEDLRSTSIWRRHCYIAPPPRVAGECVVVSRRSRLRGQAVAKRVHPRTRFPSLTAAFRAVPLVCCDLPLRRHQLLFRCLRLAGRVGIDRLGCRRAQRLGARCGGLLQPFQILVQTLLC